MNIQSILLLGVVLLAVAAALYILLRRKGCGSSRCGSCHGCHGCPPGHP